MDASSKVLAAAAAGLGLACFCSSGSAGGRSELTSEAAATLKQQLVEQGYCVVPSAMSKAEIAEIADTCHELLDRPENQQFQEDKFTGSLVPLSKHQSFSKLIAHSATLNALAKLGFKPPRWLSGFIISKPPGGPSLGWHQGASPRPRLPPRSAPLSPSAPLRCQRPRSASTLTNGVECRRLVLG